MLALMTMAFCWSGFLAGIENYYNDVVQELSHIDRRNVVNSSLKDRRGLVSERGECNDFNV
jgi:hypothetical protein